MTVLYSQTITTPLGQMLFSGCLPLTRSPLQFARAEPFLLARRSTFDYCGDRLDLVEGFLPAAVGVEVA